MGGQSLGRHRILSLGDCKGELQLDGFEPRVDHAGDPILDGPEIDSIQTRYDYSYDEVSAGFLSILLFTVNLLIAYAADSPGSGTSGTFG